MKINIDVQSGQLIAENVQSEQVNKVIEGFFNLLGSEVKTVVKTVSSSPTKVTEKVTNIEHHKNEKTSKISVQNPPKITPKVNGNWSLNVPIGEIVESKQIKADIPEHWKTGIFYNNNNEPRYQTKYWCNCGNQGKRYAEKDAEYIHCHKCDQKLLVEPATSETDESGLPKRDHWGNFYIAREVFKGEGE